MSEHSAESVRRCLCKEVPAEPFPRRLWHKDCPDHGEKVNPYWDEALGEPPDGLEGGSDA